MERFPGEVGGGTAVAAAGPWLERAAAFAGSGGGRVQVTDRLSTRGLGGDATVVVDPDGITAESPGGVRVLYVVLTRAAHRMHVLRPT